MVGMRSIWKTVAALIVSTYLPPWPLSFSTLRLAVRLHTCDRRWGAGVAYIQYPKDTNTV
jgi:hypothetical protein